MRRWLNVMLSSRPLRKLIDHLQIHHNPLRLTPKYYIHV